MPEPRSWALVTVDSQGRPETVLMLLDDPTEAEEIAAELRRFGQRVRVVPSGSAGQGLEAE